MKQVLVFHLKPGGRSPAVEDENGSKLFASTIPGAPWLAVIAVEVDASFTAEEP